MNDYPKSRIVKSVLSEDCFDVEEYVQTHMQPAVGSWQWRASRDTLTAATAVRDRIRRYPEVVSGGDSGE